MSESAYRLVVGFVAALLSIYLLGSYLAITREHGAEGELWLLTGEPRVIAPGDTLEVVLKSRVNRVVITFDQDIAGQVLSSKEYSNPLYDTSWDLENRSSVVITAYRAGDLDSAAGILGFTLPSNRLLPTGLDYTKSIASVTVDGRIYTPYEFLSTLVLREKSTVDLYYPLSPRNISSEVARILGPLLVDGVLYTLLFLAGSQALMLLFSIKQPQVVKTYFRDFVDSKAITIVDIVSRDFAISLGLLGTISAIWVALEQPGTDFSSFDNILRLLRKAVFTTVLGISTKMLCALRGTMGTK